MIAGVLSRLRPVEFPLRTRKLAMANGEFVAYLPQSSGYAIILGGGFAFALFMLILSWLQSKFTETSPFESKSKAEFCIFLI